jgi:glutaredoxin
VEKKKENRPIAYLLSTCPRCHRARKQLEDLKVEIEMIDIDLLPKVDRTKIMDELRKHRPIVTFPVLKVEDEVVFGANAYDIEELFGEEE